MKALKNIDAYFDDQKEWKSGMAALRSAVIEMGFKEEVKWGMPTYTLNGKNLIGIIGFKHHFGIWFHQGVFLSDPLGVLQNAQNGKTKGMRHIKFTDSSQVNIEDLKPYLQETIENHKAGKVIKVERKTKAMDMPSLLAEALQGETKKAFEKLSTSKKNEYIEYIVTAKREATKLSRIDKILPMIKEGKGLNDKYRK